MIKVNKLTMIEFFNFIEELKKYSGFKTTIKEDIFRICREDRRYDHGKIIITKACYNKIANKAKNSIVFDYLVNKYNLEYSLEEDNTILFFKS